MILVCPKHVKEALKMMDLPHVQSISEQDLTGREKSCLICCSQAKYKLFNYTQQRIMTKQAI
ncbi:hypothetical protein [Bacillus sp. FJAT-27251]|uniref:hypothetical protein n=1 Tax=Bacillus sp. FJAT-27251 TaxID=1684142 RepID=UPI0006A77BBF|nr:hypothetical protein [Bacillus sp. FJAT-27251]